MTLSLETMSIKELRELRASVDKAIYSFEDRRRREVIAALEAVAREKGFSLADLANISKPRKQRSPATPKYFNPKDRSITWSGRGRQPSWFKTEVESGKSDADMLL